MYTFSTELFSDLFKDVNGFRPRGHWFYDANTTDEERQAEWDYLCERLSRQIKEENEAKEKAWADLEARVADLMAHGAEDEQTALRWIVESLNPSESDLWYGGEWVCYELGIGFDRGYVFNKACKEILDRMQQQKAA